MKFRRLLISVVMLLCSMLPLSAVAELTPVQVNGEVSYVTGGVGLEESTAIKEMRQDYPLTMVFAETTGDGRNQYIYGVLVEIRRGNDLVFETQTRGPYLLVRLPPGTYRVRAIHNMVPKVQTITVGTKPQQVGWAWPAIPDVNDPHQSRQEPEVSE
jgi:hypothetical protein